MASLRMPRIPLLGKGIKKAGKALAGPSDQELKAQLQNRMYPDLEKVGKAAMKPAAEPKAMAKPDAVACTAPQAPIASPTCDLGAKLIEAVSVPCA